VSIIVLLILASGLYGIFTEHSKKEQAKQTIRKWRDETWSKIKDAEKDKKMSLISTNDNITELLLNVGFDKICLIVDSLDACTPDYCELPLVQESDKKLVLTMLDAHRELIGLSEKNKLLFQSVVDYLENYE